MVEEGMVQTNFENEQAPITQDDGPMEMPVQPSINQYAYKTSNQSIISSNHPLQPTSVDKRYTTS